MPVVTSSTMLKFFQNSAVSYAALLPAGTWNVVYDGKVTFVCASSKAAVAKGLKAGDLVKAAAVICGGNGGGRPDMAQAGGKDTKAVPEAIEEVRRIIRSA